ncbi:MAG: SAP domain-containing protein [Gallionella sp.]|nr:SAP domain-containing protein [Gallionella sp.]
MKLEEIRGIAKSHNIKAGNLSKAELIRTIQTQEGNFACYGSANNSECDQANCLWRKDCFEASPC